jgi:hypothetical protein
MDTGGLWIVACDWTVKIDNKLFFFNGYACSNIDLSMTWSSDE